MIIGAHMIVYTADADADRAFFRDVLRLRSVDAGHGWLIFALPPAEAAFHPGDNGRHELYLMCDDLNAEMEALKAKGVACSAIANERWGSITHTRCPAAGRSGCISRSIRQRSDKRVPGAHDELGWLGFEVSHPFARKKRMDGTPSPWCDSSVRA